VIMMVIIINKVFRVHIGRKINLIFYKSNKNNDRLMKEFLLICGGIDMAAII
jgi:hypothetical protein